MSTAVKLDTMSSKDLSNYLEKTLTNNPFENFKIENYKYAQLHKNITSNRSLEYFKPDLSSIISIKNLKSTDTSDVDLLGDLNNWKYNNTDSYFRVNSISERSSKKIDLDLYEDEIIYLDLSLFKENIQLLKDNELPKTLIINNSNFSEDYPRAIILNLSENAKLNIIHYNISNSKSFLYFEINQQSKSNVKFLSFQSNNVHTRNEFFASLDENCSLDLCGLNIHNYGVNDNYSFIQHLKPSSQSREIFKSIVKNGAVTNFQGKIYVDSMAQKTDGYQMSRSLLLDNESKANNKPELEIYADDVKCSHGSTVSKLNKDQVYYFKSRGIDEEQAIKILQKAFLAETLEAIEKPQIKEYSFNLLDSKFRTLNLTFRY